MSYKLTPVVDIRGHFFPLDGKSVIHDKPSRETKALIYFPYGISMELAFRKKDLSPYGHKEAILQELEDEPS